VYTATATANQVKIQRASISI